MPPPPDLPGPHGPPHPAAEVDQDALLTEGFGQMAISRITKAVGQGTPLETAIATERANLAARPPATPAAPAEPSSIDIALTTKYNPLDPGYLNFHCFEELFNSPELTPWFKAKLTEIQKEPETGDITAAKKANTIRKMIKTCAVTPINRAFYKRTKKTSTALQLIEELGEQALK
jgi:hypothetical protein